MALSAQEVAHFNITQLDGLPSNTVYDIFQDSKGFLWVATENGLARYNGISFRSYHNRHLHSTAVSNLLEDNNGRIWLHNFFGEILFVENDTLKKLDSWEERHSEGFPSLTIAGNQLLINSSKKIFNYQTNTGLWQDVSQVEKTDSAHNTIHFSHLVDNQGVKWVCYSTDTHTYVEALHASTQKTYRFQFSPYRFNKNVARMFVWQGKLWLFDAESSFLFELTNGDVIDRTEQYSGMLKHTQQIQNVGDSLLAFKGPNGAYLLNAYDQWQHLLPGKIVSAVTTDREGGLWVGTLNEGIFYFPNQDSYLYSKEKFGLYTKLEVDTKRNQLLAGNYSGRVDVFSVDGKIVNSIDSKSNKEVQSLFIDSLSNQLCIFTNSLRFYDLTNQRQTLEIALAAGKKIIRAGKYLALATSAGLYLYDPLTQQRIKFFNAQRIVSLAYENETEFLWVGTQKGLYKHHLPTNTTKRWEADAAGYSPGATSSLAYGNYLFIGTPTNGLYILRNDMLAHHFTTSNGLCSNRIIALALLNNTLWMGTDKGICVLDLLTKKITYLNETKGLSSQEVYDLTFVKNHLWVSHAQGLQQFISFSTPNTQPPQIHLNLASTSGTYLINPQQGITLAPGSQQLSLEFDVSNNLKSRGASKILYRIKELEGGRWNETSLKNPTANFLSLPHGTFTFEAVAKNEDGVVSGNKLVIPLIIIAPFWKRLWFITIVFLMAVCLVAFSIYLRFKKINEQNKLRLLQQNQEQELRIAQLTSIRAQMNPHFVFNTLAHIQSQVLNGMKEAANQSIQNFSSLLRKVLDFSSKELIPLQDEIEVLQKYLSIEKDRFDGALQYEITVAESVQNEMVRIPSLLTQPFVENALRHGLMHRTGEKKLSIRIDLENDCLVILIRDNGIGRKASAEFNKARKKEHQSFALEAYSRRIDLLNASHDHKITLTINDHYNELGAATGTSVCITISLEHEPARKK
jgi:ligand-binding sensor domain-containing protein